MMPRNLEAGTGDWVVFEAPRHGFSFKHPSDWEVVRGVAGLLASVAAPDGEGFRSNMNVVRRVRDKALDLDGLAESSRVALMRLLSDAIVVDVDSDVVADQPVRRLLVAYRQGLYALTSEQWLWIEHEHIWTISAGALTERWDAEADTFDAIAHSFSRETI